MTLIQELIAKLKDARIESLIVRSALQGEGYGEPVQQLDEIDEKFGLVLQLITPPSGA